MIFKFLTSINLSKDCIGSPKSTEQLQIDMHIFANLGKRFGSRNLIIFFLRQTRELHYSKITGLQSAHSPNITERSVTTGGA